MHDVLVIGCGNIAGGFDADRPADALPLTHAGAYARHGGFKILTCVDPDAPRRAAFARRWNVPLAVADIGDVERGRYDVISIASPTERHAEHLEAALALRPRLIFCEKPVTPSAAQTFEWVKRARDAGVALAVNHTRRWAPDVVRLARDLRDGALGTVRSVTGWYSKGVLNNGAHMIDLLHMLLGPVQLMAAGIPVDDFWADDPTIPVLLKAGGVPVHLVTGHAADYARFELEIATDRVVLTMEEGGRAWRLRTAEASDTFSGYRMLGAEQRLPGEYDHAMLTAATNIDQAIAIGEPLASDGASALAAQQVCEAIRAAAVSPSPASTGRAA